MRASKEDVLHYIALSAATPLWWLTLQSVQMRKLTDIGLIGVLPIGYFLAIGIVTLSFCVSLRRRIRQPLAVIHVLLLILMLYGIPNVVEEFPRLSVTYRHIGIIDYIDRTQSVDPSIDAYFNWPGFFILSALLRSLTGAHNIVTVAALAPLFFNIIYLAPLVTIVSSFTRDTRLIWLACWCFYVANWVNQDYFSPQALAFFFYLAVLALVVQIFRPAAGTSPVDSSRRRWLRRALDVLGSREAVQQEQPTATRVVSMIIIILASIATVASHQLTPFALLAGLLGLTLLKRTTARKLVLLVAVICAIWLGFMALTYLRGNIQSLVDSVGQLGGNVGAATTSRLQGTGGHLFIVRWSLIMTALFWFAASVGVVVRVKRGMWDVTCACLAVSPFSLILVQPYGGEILLRVYLFALPFMSLFVAALLVPRAEVLTKARQTTIFLVTVSLAASFLLLRYGNEKGSYFPREDIAAIDHLYDAASPHSLLVAASPSVPWESEHYEYTHEVMSEWKSWERLTSHPPTALVLVDVLRAEARQKGKSDILLVLTATQDSYAEMLGLSPPNWISEMEAVLSRSGLIVILYKQGNTAIFRLSVE